MRTVLLPLIYLLTADKSVEHPGARLIHTESVLKVTERCEFVHEDY